MERKLKRFNILLDDESLLYFPGSFLTGKVLVELEEKLPTSGLYFHIIGEGVVRLHDDGKAGAAASQQQKQKRRQRNDEKENDKSATKKRRKKVLASERENYIDFRMRLLGGGGQSNQSGASADRDSCLSESDNLSLVERQAANTSGDDDDDNDNSDTDVQLILAPGVHTFPFKLGLPSSLPSTFLGAHGWVQYFCRAILKEPNGLVHKNQQVFIIINPIDLNLEPSHLQQPFYCEAEERVARRSCLTPGGGRGSGLVSCRVRLDRGAFVPGECIHVSASIENASRHSIRRTRAILTETVEYKCKRSAGSESLECVQSETRQLACVERGKIGARSTDVWKKEQLHIPALPPTNLRGCRLIKIHYDVFFQIITKHNVKKPIELQLPIVMATYPIRNKDGTLKRRKNAAYPDNLPILRPWLTTKPTTTTT